MKIRINVILTLLLCFNAALLFLIVDTAESVSEENKSENIACACEYSRACEPVIENDEEIEIIEEESEVEFDSFYVPETSGFKSYMSYKMITNTNSKQYKLQNEYAYTGNYGIRMVNDRYCIALGSYFTHEIGQYVDLILENGTVIPCILAEAKADEHTDKYNIVTMHNGCVSEFIVSDVLDSTAKKMGDISYCNEDWKSPVSEVVVYDKNVFTE